MACQAAAVTSSTSIQVIDSTSHQDVFEQGLSSSNSSPQQEIEVRSGQPSLLRRIPSAGIWCSVVGNFGLAVSYAMTKGITDQDNVLTLTLIRLGMQTVLLLPAVIFFQDPPLGKRGERVLVLMWSVIFALGHLLLNYSFSYIPVADASAVYNAYPILTTLISPYFLGEPFRKIYPLSAIVALVGVVLIDRPSFLNLAHQADSISPQNRLIGVGLALASAFCGAAASILNRKIQETSVRVFMLHFGAIGTFVCGIAIAATRRIYLPLCGLGSALGLLSGASLAGGASLVGLGYQLSQAGPLSVVGMLEVPFVLVLQVVFLKEYPDWTTLVGVLLVCLAVFMTIMCLWTEGRVRLYQFCRNCFRRIFRRGSWQRLRED